MTFSSRRFLVSVLGCGALFAPGAVVFARQAAPAAQEQAQPANTSDQDQDQDPLKRQLSPRQRYKAQKALHQELSDHDKVWLNQEVPYIITDDEKKAFLSLGNEEERDAFIESFWQRRNPNPDSPENEYREEH